MNERSPMFNVPPVVLATLAILVSIHAARSLLSEELDNWFVLAMAFIPARYDGYAEALPGGQVASATSFFSHALVHGHMAHLMLNSAWLLAFGGAVAHRIGALRFLAFALLCAAAGATTFLALNWGLLAPMVGASGAVAGLMAGTFRFLFPALDRGGLHLLRTNPRSVRLMGLAEVWIDRRMVAVTLVWVGINALAAVGLGAPGAGGAIAWEAHIGGYFAGLLTFGLFELRKGAGAAARDDVH